MFSRGRSGQSRARPCAALRTLDGLRRPRTESPAESDWRPQRTAILLRPGELSKLPRHILFHEVIPSCPVRVRQHKRCRTIALPDISAGVRNDQLHQPQLARHPGCNSRRLHAWRVWYGPLFGNAWLTAIGRKRKTSSLPRRRSLSASSLHLLTAIAYGSKTRTTSCEQGKGPAGWREEVVGPPFCWR